MQCQTHTHIVLLLEPGKIVMLFGKKKSFSEYTPKCFPIDRVTFNDLTHFRLVKWIPQKGLKQRSENTQICGSDTVHSKVYMVHRKLPISNLL